MELAHNAREAPADCHFQSGFRNLRAVRLLGIRPTSLRKAESYVGMRSTTMKSTQKLLTPKEVAEWLDVSVDWVQSHATRKAPRLPVVRIGKLLRFRNEDVEEFIRGQSPRKRGVLAANGRLTQETRWGEAETA